MSTRHGPVRRSTRNNPANSLLEPAPTRRSSVSRSRTRSHARTFSNGTNFSIRTTSTKRARRKYHLRQSLIGPQVEELTIERRAEMLVDAAGDCLVKLLRAGMDGARSRRGTDKSEWRKSWESFQTLRRSYIFPDDAPPFVLYTDILRDIDLGVQERLNPASLKRAVELCNLTHFVYAIFQPDEAGDLLAPTEGRTSRKGKEKASNYDILSRVQRRNAVMVDAWEKYWLVTVPRNQRDKEDPLRIWLDFATQIFITYQCPSISDGDGPSNSFPPPSNAVLLKLFNPSAVSRYGQWESTTGFDSDDSTMEGMEQRIVEERWAKAIRRREKELREADIETLGRRYPYEVFKQEVLAYIEADVLGTGIHLSSQDIQLASDSEEGGYFSSEIEDIKPSRASPRKVLQPRQSSLRPIRTPVRGQFIPLPGIFGQPNGSETGESSQDGYQSTDDEDMAEAEAFVGDESDVEGGIPSRADPLQLDLFAEIAREMEELENGEVATPRQARDVSRGAPQNDEDQWEIRDAIATPRITIQSEASRIQTFHFGAKQPDAARVDWESQSETPRQAESQVCARPRGPETPRPDIHQRAVTSEDTPRASRANPRLPLSPIQLHDTGSSRYSVPPSPFVRNPGSTSPRPPISSNHVAADLARSAISEVIELQDDDDEEDEEIDEEEETEQIENADFAVGDLLPDDHLLLGDRGESSEGPRTPLDLDISDLMPTSSQLLDESYQPRDLGHLESDVDPSTGITETLDQVIIVDGAEDQEMRSSPYPEPVVRAKIPTSQRLLASTRPRHSRDALEFAQPDPEEDEEDRQLLQRAPVPAIPVVASGERIVITAPSPLPFIKNSSPPLIERQGSQYQTMTEEDPYLVDAEGSPLEPKEEYVVPNNHQTRPSKIHGQIPGQLTSYSRISGKRRWTKDEEILLYRTVQQVPITEPYPLRVVWYLHGENGAISNELQEFNPQHMKDKMRVIVNTRINNNRPVIGRARYFLPTSNPLRAEFDQEMEQLRAAEKERQRLEWELRVRRDREREAKKEEEDDEVDEEDTEDVELDDEDINELESDTEVEEDELESEEDDKPRIPGQPSPRRLPRTRSQAKTAIRDSAKNKRKAASSVKSAQTKSKSGESSKTRAKGNNARTVPKPSQGAGPRYAATRTSTRPQRGDSNKRSSYVLEVELPFDRPPERQKSKTKMRTKAEKAGGSKDQQTGEKQAGEKEPVPNKPQFAKRTIGKFTKISKIPLSVEAGPNPADRDSVDQIDGLERIVETEQMDERLVDLLASSEPTGDKDAPVEDDDQVQLVVDQDVIRRKVLEGA